MKKIIFPFEAQKIFFFCAYTKKSQRELLHTQKRDDEERKGKKT